MERLGLQRAHAFRWEETARKTLAIYYDVAQEAKGRPAAMKEPAKVEVRQA